MDCMFYCSFAKIFDCCRSARAKQKSMSPYSGRMSLCIIARRAIRAAS